MRAAVVEGRAPGAVQLGVMGAWLVLALASGFWVFAHYRPRFAEEA
jgi:ABC-type polysaccharide/polyol phosphate export permease